MEMTCGTDKIYGRYSDVVERQVDWLWYPYIPYGKLTLLQGDPGDGKSTFMLNLVSILSKGGALPDGSKELDAMTVVYQCAEDDSEDTIKPRLITAGADCSKVFFIKENDDVLSLTDDRIEKVIKEIGAKLLILDPLQAFIPPDADMQSAQKMRSMTRRLSEMAARNNCAVVMIGHMNKATGGKNLYRGLGSIDIAAVVRSVLMIVRDDENSNIRYMFPVKSNLAPEGDAIGFYFDPACGFQWLGRCRMKQETDAVSGAVVGTPMIGGKKDIAMELLPIILSAGDVLSTEVMQRMKQLGIQERTVRTAQKNLGIKAYKNGKAWYWRLEKAPEENNTKDK